MANQVFSGYEYDDLGVAINGATVNLYDVDTTTPVRATTTTNASGYWTISHATEGRFDVEIVNGTSKRRRKYLDEVQLKRVEIADLFLRNPADTFDYNIVPGAITADRVLNVPLLTADDTLVAEAMTQTLTNKSIVASQLTGIIADARMPDLTGDVTTVEGAVATTIANDAVTNAKLANMAVDTVKGRVTAGTGDPEDVATTGSGNVVRATSPTLVTPALGTPASGVLTNVTGLPTAGLVDDAVTNVKAANMAANTVKANATALSADPADLAVGANTVVGRAGADIVAAQVATAQVADAAVTLAKMADIATARFIGRTTAATGVPEALTAAQATALLDAATATVKGLVPAPPNNTTTFLRGDATFAAPAAGAVTRAGGNTTEATTTSTTAVDLLSATGLSIAAALPVLSHFAYRKTSGAAAAVQVGVKINATQIIANAARTGAANAATSGYVEFTLYSRVTSYNGTRNVQAIVNNNNDGEVFFNGITAAPPIASTTDVIATGLTNDALVTLGADEMQVYTYTAS